MENKLSNTLRSGLLHFANTLRTCFCLNGQYSVHVKLYIINLTFRFRIKDLSVNMKQPLQYDFCYNSHILSISVNVCLGEKIAT